MSENVAIEAGQTRSVTGALALILALACGFIAANLYYAQPLTGLIGAALGLGPAQIGLLVTMTQIGYGLGLILFVPLGDLVENRSLAVGGVAVAMAALVVMALAQSASVFLTATLIAGIACSTVQILLPFAAHFTTEADRGKVIGSLTSGLMLGIMLARPAASIVTYWAGWRAVFWLSAVLMGLVASALWLGMPRRQPTSTLSYLGILRSMPSLLREVPILRRRAAYHAALYASFSMFWTAVALLLASDRFGLSQQGIALFALAGTGGVIIAPLAGTIADRGWTRPATGLAILAVLSAFVIALIGGEFHSIALLVACGGADRRRPRDQFRAQPTRDLWPEAGEPQPHRRPVHRHVLHRRRTRLGARSGNARRRWLAPYMRHRCCVRRCRTRALCWRACLVAGLT